MSTTPSHTLRAPNRADALEITRLIQRANVRVSGAPDFDEASFAAFWRHGQPRIRLGVDADNATGATRLYERAGMSVLRKYVLCRKSLVER